MIMSNFCRKQQNDASAQDRQTEILDANAALYSLQRVLNMLEELSIKTPGIDLDSFASEPWDSVLSSSTFALERIRVHLQHRSELTKQNCKLERALQTTLHKLNCDIKELDDIIVTTKVADVKMRADLDVLAHDISQANRRLRENGRVDPDDS